MDDSQPNNETDDPRLAALLRWREELIAARPTGHENQPIQLTTADEIAIAWIAGMGIVQAVLAASLIVYVLRRRYR